jgi:hypothetical protein
MHIDLNFSVIGRRPFNVTIFQDVHLAAILGSNPETTNRLPPCLTTSAVSVMPPPPPHEKISIEANGGDTVNIIAA